MRPLYIATDRKHMNSASKGEWEEIEIHTRHVKTSITSKTHTEWSSSAVKNRVYLFEQRLCMILKA
jgi:hypothetical protein